MKWSNILNSDLVGTALSALVLREKRNRTLEAVAPFAVGLAVGAAVALLFAPEEGSGLRRKLAYRLRIGTQRPNGHVLDELIT